MFVYISIASDKKKQPCFRVSANHRPVAEFPPTVEGLKDLGRLIRSNWPGLDVYFSSDLDFPQDCGVNLTASEVHAAVSGEGVSVDEEGGSVCHECGDRNPTVRDDWEFKEGTSLCCDCYNESRRGKPCPQEYYIDRE